MVKFLSQCIMDIPNKFIQHVQELVLLSKLKIVRMLNQDEGGLRCFQNVKIKSVKLGHGKLVLLSKVLYVC